MIEQRTAENTFSFFLRQDEGKTKRLEVTVFKGSNCKPEGEPKLIWSTARDLIFPNAHWEPFIDEVQKSIMQD